MCLLSLFSGHSSTLACHLQFLTLQGGGQEGEEVLSAEETHPHPNPPLEGKGVSREGVDLPYRQEYNKIIKKEAL